MFRQNLLCFSLCTLSLVLTLGTSKMCLPPPSLHLLFRYVFIGSLPIQAQQSQLSQPLIVREVLWWFGLILVYLDHSCTLAPWLDSLFTALSHQVSCFLFQISFLESIGGKNVKRKIISSSALVSAFSERNSEIYHPHPRINHMTR